ncbi:MAG: ATP-dependent Clp protease ATP-binding subunit [Candidatus Eremiobacteraeota bacterium]|nr:ATP-dependent Clp protease ATP-binding subunit [Candidatus Eremiobacteraeota bacterium]
MERLITRDLTLQAVQGSIAPKYRRDRELRLLQEILCRRKRCNALLVGDHGVGKRVIVESLAISIALGEIPSLRFKRIVEVNPRALFVPEIEKPSALFDELLVTSAAAGNIILFIEDIDTLYYNDEHDTYVRNVLEKYLDSRSLAIIATTTPFHERPLLEDQHLKQYFTSLFINEPREEECVKIIMNMKHVLESYYAISIAEDIITHAVRLSNRYVRNKFQPDRALDLLDSACARMICMASPQGEQGRQDAEGPVLNTQHLESYLEDALGIPLSNKGTGKNALLGSLESLIAREIIGQEEATEALCDILRVNLGFPEIRGARPEGIFLLLGPTGVGKTEMARIIARLLFKNDSSFIRLNMSEYSEPHSVSRLIGAPPGYVGYNEGVILTELIAKTPHSLLLLDEIEKAHHHVQNLFLQIFDEGKLRDSKGDLVSFQETLIFMTGNIGAELLDTAGAMGFIQRTPDEIEVSDDSLDREIRKYFSKEFINRIDRIILFKPLKKETVRKIIRQKYLARIEGLLKDRNIALSVGKDVEEVLALEGFSSRYGVRYLERKFNDLIAVEIGRILYREPDRVSRIAIKAVNGSVVIEAG